MTHMSCPQGCRKAPSGARIRLNQLATELSKDLSPPALATLVTESATWRFSWRCLND